MLAGLALLFGFIILSLKPPIAGFEKLFQGNFIGKNNYGGFLSKALCLKKALPINTGMVGYVINKDGAIPREPGQYTNETTLYYLTQFALIPTAIEDNLNHDYLMSNLQDPASIKAVADSLHLSIIKDCGNGMILFKKQRP